MNYRVIIIDDEPWSREVIKSIGQWHELGLTLIGEAEDGHQAIALIESLKPEIAVTDMRMPGLGGTELLKSFSSRFPDLKIIVMSGFDDFQYLQQAIRSQAVEYLLKPVDPHDLNAALAKCVDELNQAASQKAGAWRAPFVFKSGELLDLYLATRKQIAGHLLELNYPAVRQAFADLLKALNREFSGSPAENLPAKLVHDFILLLEEYLKGNEIPAINIWNDRNSEWLAAAGWQSLTEAITALQWIYEQAITAVSDAHQSKNRIDLIKIQQYIEHYYAEQITLDSIAQVFFVSKEYLSRVFKAKTGQTVLDFITEKRMEAAKTLIVDQGMEIKHAALLAGYPDLAYFYRVFKKYYGFPPGELRSDH